MHAKDVAQQLNTLNSELSALLVLAYRLAEETRGVLARIELLAEEPTPREVARQYMTTAPQSQLRADLRMARGERSAANLRTRLTRDLAARGGNGASRAA